LSPRPPCPDAFFSSAARSFMALRSVVENPPVLLVFIVLPPQRLLVDQVRSAPSRAEGTDIRRAPDSSICTGWEDPAFVCRGQEAGPTCTPGPWSRWRSDTVCFQAPSALGAPMPGSICTGPDADGRTSKSKIAVGR